MGLNGSGNWTETECYSVIELIVQSSWGQDWSRWKTRKTGETETFTQYFIISQINTFSECELSISANVLSKIMVAHMTYVLWGSLSNCLGVDDTKLYQVF